MAASTCGGKSEPRLLQILHHLLLLRNTNGKHLFMSPSFSPVGIRSSAAERGQSRFCTTSELSSLSLCLSSHPYLIACSQERYFFRIMGGWMHGILHHILYSEYTHSPSCSWLSPSAIYFVLSKMACYANFFLESREVSKACLFAGQGGHNSWPVYWCQCTSKVGTLDLVGQTTGVWVSCNLWRLFWWGQTLLDSTGSLLFSWQALNYF